VGARFSLSHKKGKENQEMLQGSSPPVTRKRTKRGAYTLGVPLEAGSGETGERKMKKTGKEKETKTVPEKEVTENPHFLRPRVNQRKRPNKARDPRWVDHF